MGDKEEAKDLVAQHGTRPLWVIILAVCFGLAGLVLFFLPIGGVKFWTLDYLFFLASLTMIPAFLFVKKGRYLRGLFLLASLAYFGFLQTACPRPTGAIELMALHLFDDASITMHLIKVAVLILGGVLFSRYFCGWICPKGIIQEYVYMPALGFRVPPKLDRILKFGKYLSLVALVAAPMIWHFRFFREWGGPFKVIFNLDGSVFLISYLAVVLVASVFIGRAFCRYLCPIGGLLALLALISPVRMRVDGCRGCGLCEKVCSVDAITTRKGEGISIDRSECIMCRECESACKWDCLSVSGPKKSELGDRR
ncbi:MAG: 4Fe-4S binding protein [Deltaproteobacteria bacterium]|nr:4Fe-4S binding protein [Deltaproteobacteria bacterium]